LSQEDKRTYEIWLSNGSAISAQMNNEQIKKLIFAWQDTTPRLVHLCDCYGELFLQRENWIAFALPYEPDKEKAIGYNKLKEVYNE
jgi:hypothetical protein